ncbi:MAG: DUF1569 domain-containing protein [Chitinophagales bacterium]|nr:DUF1569 domain-containing protein [Chitinophagales bacterium]
MAKLLWDKENQRALEARFENLKADNKRQWGKMTISQMLRHLDVALKNPLNEVEVKKNPLETIVSFKPVKHFFVYALPFMKNLPTADEFKVTEALDFDTEKEEFLKTYHKLIEKADTMNFASHPIFGNMSKREWGAMLYKHIDHHLRQFSA